MRYYFFAGSWILQVKGFLSGDASVIRFPFSVRRGVPEMKPYGQKPIFDNNSLSLILVRNSTG